MCTNGTTNEELKAMASINIIAQHTANLPTLRDQFAMVALSGLQVNPNSNSFGVKPEDIAKYCYSMADEMIKARK